VRGYPFKPLFFNIGLKTNVFIILLLKYVKKDKKQYKLSFKKINGR